MHAPDHAHMNMNMISAMQHHILVQDCMRCRNREHSLVLAPRLCTLSLSLCRYALGALGVQFVAESPYYATQLRF
jgi:hypothetical protein